MFSPHRRRQSRTIFVCRNKTSTSEFISVFFASAKEEGIFFHPVLFKHCWVGRQEGHLACIKVGVGLLVVTIWLELCKLQLPPLTTSIILAPIKSRMETFWHRLTKVLLEKWMFKHRERLINIDMGDEYPVCAPLGVWYLHLHHSTGSDVCVADRCWTCAVVRDTNG